MMNENLKNALRGSLGPRFIEDAERPVVAPADEQELAKVLALLRVHNARLQRDVWLSRRAFNQIGSTEGAADGSIDIHSAIIWVGAGVSLADLERAVNPVELTIGPLSPAAMKLDVGGFIESPYAGLRAVPGGRLESVCLSLKVMTANGVVYGSQASPRSAAGPDLDALIQGSGGRLGLVLSAAIRCFAKPVAFRVVSYRFNKPGLLVRALRDAVADGCWFESARVGVAGDGSGVQIDAKLIGSSDGVDDDLCSLGFRATERGGVAVSQALSSTQTPASNDCEYEVTWPALIQALDCGVSMSLYRLTLASVVVDAKVDGMHLDQPTPWAMSQIIELAGMVDSEKMLGGVP